ncbi:zinc-binding alcohol dehydrogenase [Sphingobium sp. EM0848]|uniref:zinc-dependent alcohol dehydrogenase n=1 Tax=Sphingobium sp. EM0848 TaxID=2743473 RepID=UPI00159CB61E|nr:zinc-binding alcohol dehydrogenase [Sphingobium sp. EM0848]
MSSSQAANSPPGSSRTARALWFEAKRVAALRTEPLLAPTANQIQVRALHSLVSAGTELSLYTGKGDLPIEMIPTNEGTRPFPIKFGYQVVGEVIEAGAATDFAVGDLVYTMQPHQDLFNIEAISPFVTRIPRGSDPLRAAFYGLFLVAMHSFLQCPVRPGECVVVSGLGIIGQLAAFIARKSAGKLVLVAPPGVKTDIAKWIGADAIVDPEDAAEAIAQCSDGRGADLYVETSGAPAALQTAIENTCVLGTIAVPAWYGSESVNLSLSSEFHLRSQKLISIQVLHVDTGLDWNWERRMAVADLFLKQIDIETLITHRFPFSEAPEAYKLLDEQASSALGVILDYRI